MNISGFARSTMIRPQHRWFLNSCWTADEQVKLSKRSVRKLRADGRYPSPALVAACKSNGMRLNTREPRAGGCDVEIQVVTLGPECLKLCLEALLLSLHPYVRALDIHLHLPSLQSLPHRSDNATRGNELINHGLAVATSPSLAQFQYVPVLDASPRNYTAAS